MGKHDVIKFFVEKRTPFRRRLHRVRNIASAQFIGLASNARILGVDVDYVRCDGQVGNGAETHVVSAGLRVVW